MSSDDQKRVIGKVISVSASKFVVEMTGKTDNFTVVGFDDIHYVAALGSFIMIRVQAEYVVAEVIGLREKESTADKDDSGTLEKALSAKYLDVVPVGRIANNSFKFGVSTFPSLYADALYARDEDLDQIFETAKPEVKIDHTQQEDHPSRLTALTIGTSVVFQGYDVKVRVDDYFGGHVAILGNTGSGKSCTVATIMQSLFEKKSEFGALGSTFVMFDVNGEYRKAFTKLPPAIQRKFLKISENTNAPEALDDNEHPFYFRLPHWFLSVEEWELLLRASERTQKPVLRTALGLVTMFNEGNSARLIELKNHILAQCLQQILRSEQSPSAKAERIRGILSSFSTPQISNTIVHDLIHIHFGEMVNQEGLSELIAPLVQDEVGPVTF